MIAVLLAALLAAPSPPDTGPPDTSPPDTTRGDWVVVAVQRVIAPDQIPGQCFVQARVEQVVGGERYRAGQAVALTLACRAEEMAPGAGPTIQALRMQRRALVRLDAAGRVAADGWYGMEDREGVDGSS